MSAIKRWMDRLDNEPFVKEGQLLSAENLTKIDALRKLIFGLLSNQKMSHKELVECLMSEPYHLEYSDLALATIALNNLSEQDLLMVTFITDGDRVGIVPVFRASIRKHNRS